MPDSYGSQRPHWLDDVFSNYRGGSDQIIQALAKNEMFVAAVEQGLSAEMNQQSSSVGQPAHPGSGPGQAGRNAFIRAIRGHEADSDAGDGS